MSRLHDNDIKYTIFVDNNSSNTTKIYLPKFDVIQFSVFEKKTLLRLQPAGESSLYKPMLRYGTNAERKSCKEPDRQTVFANKNTIDVQQY